MSQISKVDSENKTRPAKKKHITDKLPQRIPVCQEKILKQNILVLMQCAHCH